jgi:hypothetical protein
LNHHDFLKSPDAETFPANISPTGAGGDGYPEQAASAKNYFAKLA